MIRVLKKYFIPHRHNGYEPHLLKKEATLAVLAIILIGELSFLAQGIILPSKTGYLAQILPMAIIENTNIKRKEYNLGPLAVNPILERAANEKAKDMAQKGYFSHNSPDGRDPWYWFDKAGYNFIYAGENLAVNFFDSYDVVNAWMDSIKHKENIVSANFTEIGIGTAKGMYKGEETIFVVQLFGKPAVALAKESGNIQGVAANSGSAIERKNTPVGDIKILKNDTAITQNASSVADGAGQMAFLAVDQDKNIVAGSASSTSSSTSAAAGIFVNGNVKKVPFMARLFSSPARTLNYIYGVLFTIILFVLSLKVFIKYDRNHHPIIINGAMMLVMLGFAMIVHKYISLYQGNIF